MGENKDLARVIKQLESTKQFSQRGTEYWSARDLQPILGYDSWRNLSNVIDRAKTACSLSGQDIENHFVDVGKMVGIGSGAEREQKDICMTRYGAYLIAMNGDSSKDEIATAQSYFAVKTREREMDELLSKGLDRLELRSRAKDLNKQLGDAAKDSGVENFGQFHSAGYKGLYDGRDVKTIKAEKGIPEKDNILDRMGNSELGINIFRITQAEEQLKNEGRIGDLAARKVHNEVGKKTRKAVADIGGTMPEDLPAEPHIKEIEKQTKKLRPKSD
ncbi:MAG: DNA damage-inducible protein D [Pyrinomonadaceae bacterium]|nr:DNA damage-inducible protein D [Pyrinomonadaceae bacterium]